MVEAFAPKRFFRIYHCRCVHLNLNTQTQHKHNAALTPILLSTIRYRKWMKFNCIFPPLKSLILMIALEKHALLSPIPPHSLSLSLHFAVSHGRPLSLFLFTDPMSLKNYRSATNHVIASELQIWIHPNNGLNSLQSIIIIYDSTYGRHRKKQWRIHVFLLILLMNS